MIMMFEQNILLFVIDFVKLITGRTAAAKPKQVFYYWTVSLKENED